MPYAPRHPDDILRLVQQNPFAWMISPGNTTPLPIVARGENGHIVGLEGHFGRGNRHIAELRENPEARILVMGPNNYISPSWFRDRTQAPTWMYAVARFRVQVTLIEDSDGIAAHLRRLIEQSERGRPNSWSPEEMGERFATLARGIVAFAAKVVDTHATFKLEQRERDDVYADIIAGLSSHEQAAPLLDWAALYNDGRDGQAS